MFLAVFPHNINITPSNTCALCIWDEGVWFILRGGHSTPRWHAVSYYTGKVLISWLCFQLGKANSFTWRKGQRDTPKNNSNFTQSGRCYPYECLLFWAKETKEVFAVCFLTFLSSRCADEWTGCCTWKMKRSPSQSVASISLWLNYCDVTPQQRRDTNANSETDSQ